jgi:hypothetical protein
MKIRILFVLTIIFCIAPAGAQTPAQGTWGPRGPFNISSAYGSVKGVGRTNYIAIDPVDSNNIFVVGGGALWKSTNDGNTWEVAIEADPDFTFVFIKYDPTDGNVLYAGILDGGPPNMGGVYKSIDAGITWTSLDIIIDVYASKLLIDPINSQNLFLSSSGAGLFKSTDGGTTWNLINTYKTDLEMNPLNPSVLYAIGTGNTVAKSTNGGVSFINSPSIPLSNGIREIAVTVNDTSYVYVFSANTAGSGQGQVALSTNAGSTFTVKPMASNLYCFNELCHLEVSPTNKNLLIQGGVRSARSTDGGTSWSLGPSLVISSPNYVHVDHRFITFKGSSFWTCNDGGVNKTVDGGLTWINKTPGLSVSYVNSISSCRSDSSKYIVGSFDDASQLYQSGVWNQTFGGDGFDVAMNPLDPMIVFGKNQYNYFRSTDGGVTPGIFTVFSGCTESLYSFNVGFPVRFNIQHLNSIFLLVKNVWKSTNNGSNVSVISNLPAAGQGGGFLYVCDIDSNIIYTKYYHTTNGGINWISNTKRVLAVDPDEPNKVWAQNNLLEPYGLFYSSNGGITWTTIPTYDVIAGANNMRCVNNANNGIFLFSGFNIYYLDDQLSNWQPFTNGLPEIKINDMNVLDNYGIVRVGTGGRGVWESSLFDTTDALVTDFIADGYSICSGDTIQFYDNSLNNGPGYSPIYQWSFPGGIPSTSNAINPQVAFTTSGTYNVTLTVTNSTGVSTASHTITVGTVSSTTITASGSIPFCENDTLILTSNLASSYLWSTGATTQSIYVSDSGNFSLIASYAVGCAGMDTISVSTLPIPDITATASNDSICQGDSVVLIGLGDPDILFVWDGGVLDGVGFSPPSTITYTVVGTDENSCSNASTITVTVNDLPTVVATSIDNNLCTGDPTTLTGGGAVSYSWSGGVTDGISFNPGATATYTVTGTDVNTCTNTATIMVTVNNLPVVIANATDTVLCTGDPTTLTGSGGSSYSWTGGVTDGISFNPFSTFTYTVTGTDINSCSNTSTISVAVNNLPLVIANATDNTLCTGDPTTLTGSGASSYSWTGGVIDGISFTPSSTFTYTVTGTDINSCSNTGSITVSVNNLPLVVANATDNTLCTGDPTILTGSGASSYSWTSGITDGISFNPSSTSTYTVTGTDINSCSNTSTITVTVNNLPVVTANATDNTLCTGDLTILTGSGASSYSWTSGITDGISFNPSSTSTYTVTGTDINSCSNTSTITVTVNNLPLVVANATDNNLCIGDPTILTGGGAVSYSWNGGVTDGVSFNPSLTLTYTVTGTDVNTCSNTATIVVTVNNLPTVNFNYPGNDTVCITNGLQVLSGGIPAGGTYTGTGVSGINFDPNAAGLGNHTIIYTFTDANSCSNTDAITITVNGCTGIENNNLSSIVVYPNPFTNSITISGINEATGIKICNMLGEILRSWVISSTSNNIILEDIAPGIYFLNIETGTGSVTKKIIKE